MVGPLAFLGRPLPHTNLGFCFRKSAGRCHGCLLDRLLRVVEPEKGDTRWLRSNVLEPVTRSQRPVWPDAAPGPVSAPCIHRSQPHPGLAHSRYSVMMTEPKQHVKDPITEPPVKMAAQADTAYFLTQPHQNYNQNTEQPSLRTVRDGAGRKSDNYGIKENTSIQTGRRGADTEQAGPSYTCGG